MKQLEELACNNIIVATFLQNYMNGNGTYYEMLFGIINALIEQNKHYESLILKDLQYIIPGDLVHTSLVAKCIQNKK